MPRKTRPSRTEQGVRFRPRATRARAAAPIVGRRGRPCRDVGDNVRHGSTSRGVQVDADTWALVCGKRRNRRAKVASSDQCAVPPERDAGTGDFTTDPAASPGTSEGASVQFGDTVEDVPVPGVVDCKPDAPANQTSFPAESRRHHYRGRRRRNQLQPNGWPTTGRPRTSTPIPCRSQSA